MYSTMKTDHLRVRLTPTEKQTVERVAESRGLPISVYVRQRLFPEPATAYEPRRDGLMSEDTDQ